MTNLKYPAGNLLPILNGKVPKQHHSVTLLKKVAPYIITFEHSFSQLFLKS